MLLFKLWIFNFDFSSLIAFIIGIFLGVALFGLAYAILVLSSLKSKKYVVKATNVEVTDEEISEIIQNAQASFKDKSLKGAKSTIAHCGSVCSNLVKDIAKKHFPKSKRPFAELTVDEILRLSVYVSDRVNELLDRPGLRNLKKIKLSTILGLGDVKKAVDSSSLMKMTKKYKVKKVFNSVKGALNVVNPFYWIRKLVVNTSLDFATKKLCLAVIGIVGEETYKIYSKRVFNEEKIIDTGVEEIASSMTEELQNVSEEDMNAYLEEEENLESDEPKRKGD